MGEKFKQERCVVIEIGAFLSISALLLLVHATVGKGTAVNHYFYPATPTLIDAWTAALLHSSWEHAISNSFAYVITILTTYLIFYRWGRRRLMWVLFCVILVTTPPVVNFSNVIVYRDFLGVVTPEMNMKGFSGVVSAFLGVLWASVGFYTNHRTNSGIGYWVVFVAYLLIGAGFLITYGAALSIAIIVALVTTTGFLLAGHRLRSSFGDLSSRRILQVMKTESDVLLMIWCIPVGLALVLGLFPAEPGAGDTMTNIVAHMAGLAWGFLITVAIVLGTLRLDSTLAVQPDSS